MRQTILKLSILVLAFWASVCWSASLFPDRYDDEFKRVAIHLPPGTDWRLLKAQCWQESRLKPNAVSPVGAVGLCQFMPGTWSEMRQQYPGLTDPTLPVHSIRAAAIYMRRLWSGWTYPRPPMDRYKFALASYNFGFRATLNAQSRCNGAVLFAGVVGCLPHETANYVPLIVDRWYPMIRRDTKR